MKILAGVAPQLNLNTPVWNKGVFLCSYVIIFGNSKELTLTAASWGDLPLFYATALYWPLHILFSRTKGNYFYDSCKYNLSWNIKSSGRLVVWVKSMCVEPSQPKHCGSVHNIHRGRINHWEQSHNLSRWYCYCDDRKYGVNVCKTRHYLPSPISDREKI